MTMCGVAQEVTQEDTIEAYTKPWHVTVTAGTVRVLHISAQSLKLRFFFFSTFQSVFLAHNYFYPCSLCPVSDPS